MAQPSRYIKSSRAPNKRSHRNEKLAYYYLKYSPRSSVGLPQELVRNAESWGPPQNLHFLKNACILARHKSSQFIEPELHICKIRITSEILLGMQGPLKKYEHYLGSPQTSWNWIFGACHKHLYSILKNSVGDFATHWRLRTSRAVFCKVKYAHKSPGDLMKMQIVVHGIMRLEIAFPARSCHTAAAALGPLCESGDARLDGEWGPVQFWTALIPAGWEGFTVSPKWAPPKDAS